MPVLGKGKGPAMNLTSYKKKAMKQLESYRDALPEMPEMPDLSDLPDEKIARGLGWVSIALGIGGIAAPRQIERMLGLEEGNGQTTGVIRAVGVRELCHGIDILSHDDPTPGLWARVAGDALDGVLLGIAARKTRNPVALPPRRRWSPASSPPPSSARSASRPNRGAIFCSLPHTLTLAAGVRVEV